MANKTSISEFLLLHFSEVQELQILHFVVFLMLYLATVLGNLLIISAVALDHNLNSPMYFFLMNLAMQDLGEVTVIFPKAMANSLMNTRHISYPGCVAQVFFFPFFCMSDFFLLTVMAYDRYVAICNPLHYELVMNRQVCIQMVACVWLSGFLFGALHTGGTFMDPFCSNVVNQFFCDLPHLLKLSCSGMNLIETWIIFSSGVIELGCVVFIIVSYVHIFTAVLRMPSNLGRQKAFSTCLPHLMVISIFLLTGWISHLKPISNTASLLDLAFGVIYSLVPPLLNPVIYSMRNKEFKSALTKLLGLRSSLMS